MNFFNRLGSRLSIKRKIILLAMLSTLIPLLIVGTFSYIYMNKAIENKISETTTNLLSLIDWNINTIVNDIQSSGEILYASNDTQDFLKQKDLTKEAYVTQGETRDLLITISSNNPYINAVYLGNENNEYLQLSKGQSVYYGKIYEHIRGTDWFKEIMEKDLYGIWFHDDVNFIESSNLLTYGRPIKDLQTLDVIGVMIFSIDKAIFKDMFKDIEQDGEIIILDKGKMIYSNSEDKLKSTKMVERINALEGKKSEMVTMNNENYIVNLDVNKLTNWKIVSIMPYKSIVKEFDFIRKVSVLLLIITLLIATFSALLISNKITKQLSLLRDVIKKMRKREKLDTISFDPEDEVGKIGHQFISLYNRNNELMVELYESQIKEKEAELKTLQSHINPHFLYNTLNSIFWMAEKAKMKPIAKMAIHLANIFKLTLNDGEYITSVKNEIDQVKSYLDIQNIRYDNRIQYQINVDENLYDERIIKLLLQPLVENAVYHGLEMKPGGWEIIINGKQENHSLVFEVIDNGIGFDRNVVLKQRTGYALKNINERIRLQYGPGYGLTIHSEEGQGTTVSLRIGLDISEKSAGEGA
ncbi:sensor histidine kinase [Neobacillus sp. 179-C4.2 HS]|uniref:Sensor histidine kinase n=1 Tax=Neobacillus driksii TaxID=3035913 RepID=A0ABV4YU11_9BACI|nr:sensor histidine kinase [Neobacillus sp. 179.-C4.2 HS]